MSEPRGRTEADVFAEVVAHVGNVAAPDDIEDLSRRLGLDDAAGLRRAVLRRTAAGAAAEQG